MTIQSKLIKNLSKVEYRDIYSLNLRKKGFSRGHLRKCFKNKDKFSRIFLCYEKDILLGWALLLQCLDANNVLIEYSTNFYVRKIYRNKGIGKKIFNEVDKFLEFYDHKAHICIWSKESENFYKNKGNQQFRIIISPNYKYV